MEEAIPIFRKVLLRCREKSIKLARHKLEFRKEVDFTGIHIGGPEGYRPTTAKINGILEIPHPSNLKVLRSFLGCCNQLRIYIPDYKQSVENMQKLLKKDVPFILDKTLQEEFKEIKRI